MPFSNGNPTFGNCVRNHSLEYTGRHFSGPIVLRHQASIRHANSYGLAACVAGGYADKIGKVATFAGQNITP